MDSTISFNELRKQIDAAIKERKEIDKKLMILEKTMEEQYKNRATKKTKKKKKIWSCNILSDEELALAVNERIEKNSTWESMAKKYGAHPSAIRRAWTNAKAGKPLRSPNKGVAAKLTPELIEAVEDEITNRTLDGDTAIETDTTTGLAGSTRTASELDA